MISIIIPSRDEPFLQKTIEDIIKNASGEIEIIAVLDGYWPDPPLEDHKILSVIHYGKSAGMRRAISSAAAIAKGEYLMKVDAHCMFMEGFDEILKADCGDDWIVVPRRYTLDTDLWQPRESTQDKPHVDYEYFIYPRKYDPPSLHGFRWNQRTFERDEIKIDDTMTFQGSCWFMKKSWFLKNNFLTDPGYMGEPKQEAEELGLTTWFNGGRVVVNKNVWYAHMHKRFAGYPRSKDSVEKCYEYSYNKWAIEHKDQFIKLIEKFWPIPSWPEDYKEKLW